MAAEVIDQQGQDEQDQHQPRHVTEPDGAVVLDLTLYTVKEINEFVKDRNGTRWRVYGGMPAETISSLLKIEAAWTSGRVTQALFDETMEGLWAFFERTHPERSLAELRRGFDLDDVPRLTAFLFSRYQTRTVAENNDSTKHGRAADRLSTTPPNRATRRRLRSTSSTGAGS